MARKKKQFCINGHDTFVVGRDKTTGRCKKCMSDLESIKHREIIEGKRIIKHVKFFCIHGHEIAIVGRDKYGSCLECRRIAFEETYVPHPKIKSPICKNGHDTNICGRDKQGKCKICKSIWAQKDSKKHRNHINKYYRDVYATNPQTRLAHLLRTRITKALNGKTKPASAISMLGCNLNELRKYIESKFLPGMTWENHGLGKDKWHIDHIRPLDSFDLTDISQFKQACHYTNLQPLWQRDNLRKSNKILV